jgi:DNA invertase Pin-like site-specific DNA recombinase
LRILNFGGDAVDTRSATGRLMLNMFAVMAQFEREIMLERQREGIARAKAEGKYKGRKPTARVKAKDAVEMFRAGKRVAQIAKDLGIGRGSVCGCSRELTTRQSRWVPNQIFSLPPQVGLPPL